MRERLKTWEIILLVLAALSLLLWGLARTVGARARSQKGAVSRTARPGVAFWGESVDVELRLDAGKLPSCAEPADIAPVYAALVIDHSGSMAGPALEAARNAASDFSDLMNLASKGDVVTVVTFDDEADLLLAFSNDRSRVVQAIQDISEGGQTNIAAGLNLATEQFVAQPPPADAHQVLILLADGQNNVGPASGVAAAADQAKAQGIRVVTIALGDADRTALAQIASSQADYYETADPSALIEIYEEIAAGIVGVAATDITLDEYVNLRRFDLTGGLYRAQQNGNHITWQMSFVGRRGRSVGYFLRPRSLGWHQVSPTAGQMSLTDCSGQALDQAIPTGPRVLVLFPVWLLYIFPALALLWALYRLIRALRRPPARSVGAPVRRTGVVGKPVEKKKKRKDGADVTHGRPKKPRKR